MKMKLPEIIRPEFDIEYSGIKGLFLAIKSLIQVYCKGLGVKRKTIEIKWNEKTVHEHKIWIVPKFHLVKKGDAVGNEE